MQAARASDVHTCVRLPPPPIAAQAAAPLRRGGAGGADQPARGPRGALPAPRRDAAPGGHAQVRAQVARRPVRRAVPGLLVAPPRLQGKRPDAPPRSPHAEPCRVPTQRGMEALLPPPHVVGAPVQELLGRIGGIPVLVWLLKQAISKPTHAQLLVLRAAQVRARFALCRSTQQLTLAARLRQRAACRGGLRAQEGQAVRLQARSSQETGDTGASPRLAAADGRAPREAAALRAATRAAAKAGRRGTLIPDAQLRVLDARPAAVHAATALLNVVDLERNKRLMLKAGLPAVIAEALCCPVGHVGAGRLMPTRCTHTHRGQNGEPPLVTRLGVTHSGDGWVTRLCTCEYALARMPLCCGTSDMPGSWAPAPPRYPNRCKYHTHTHTHTCTWLSCSAEPTTLTRIPRKPRVAQHVLRGRQLALVRWPAGVERAVGAPAAAELLAGLQRPAGRRAGKDHDRQAPAPATATATDR